MMSVTAAAAGGPVRFAFNGYGTLGAMYSDFDHADFTSAVLFHPKGVGDSRSWAVDQETRLGFQVTAELGERFTGVVQVISQLRYDNTFKPTVEWANLKYRVTPNFDIRVGRTVLPTYLTSQSLNVGFIHPWVRTPAEILVQLPLTNSDGVDLSYRLVTGSLSTHLQFAYGENSSKVVGDTEFQNRRIKTLASTFEYSSLKLRLGYQHMYYAFPGLLPEVQFDCYELGVMYDPGDWYVTGEQFNTRDDGVGHTQAWYLGGGYRWGSITPYAFAARIKQTSVGTFQQAPVFNQKTLGVGMRWDFMKNFAAKLQYDRVEAGSDLAPTSFIRLQPGFRSGDHANVLSATVDFLW